MKPSSVFGPFAYEEKILELVAYDYEGLKELFFRIEELRQKYFCLGFLAYEAYKAFDDHSFTSTTPLAYFGIFSFRSSFTPPKSNDVFTPLFPQWIAKEEYLHKIEQLKEQIKEGNTYQGNLTTTFYCSSTLSSYEIFLSLLHKQDTHYRCFLPTPFGDVISFSPELFFSIQNEDIITKPMKGTMPRGQSEKEDQANKEFLRNDLKNRSENVMIVDLLRNDLSKIAQKASVKVPHLFEIETYPTLFQMTSTITAKLKKTELLEVFQALFPCGSISGAPKRSTLEILHRLEGKERGVYCGALGVVEKERALFSIPIRTLFKQENKISYGVGSGIVWDSVGESEYEELKTKMSFLSVNFDLIETMLYENHKIPFLQKHLSRLHSSAQALGFSFPKDLEQELRALELEGKFILRVTLKRGGEYTLHIQEFIPHTSNAIILKKREGKSDLYPYKTTYRPWAEGIEYGKVFDAVFYDERGYLSEGSRSNLLLEIEGKLYTPKFDGNFLKGIYREEMIRCGQVSERELKVEDLKSASKIFCVNSVRGRVEVNLIEIYSKLS